MGGKSTTTKQTNEPPKWAEPLFKEGAKDALRLYDKNKGGNVYQGSTYAGLGTTTQNALSDLRAAGKGYALPEMAQAQAAYGRVMANPGINASNNMLTGIASGQEGINTEADYRNILSQAGGQSAADKYLTDTAAGNYLTDGNPYYRQRLDKEIADAAAKMQTMYAGKGRYGSMTAQQGIGEMTGNMLLQGLESDYNRERALQMQAVGMLDDQRNAGIGNRLAAVSGISGIQGQNLGNRMAAAGQMSQATAADVAARMGAADALASTGQQEYENRLTGAQAQLQAGQMLDQHRQTQLDDEIAKFYANDNKDWNRLAMLFSAAQGSAGNYGTQMQTTRQPFNPLSIFGPLMGGMMSDRRLKENVEHVGEKGGFDWYEFNYIGRPDIRFRGVMAQDVAEVRPDAIGEWNGYMTVDYDALGLKMEVAHDGRS